jgi:hypothetical protein
MDDIAPTMDDIAPPRLSAIDRTALLRQLAARPGGATVACAGRSMLPTVRPGDRVQVRRGPVRPGDVVLFSTGDRVTLHRLLWKVPLAPYFVHRGDAPGAALGISPTSALIGRADLPRVELSLRNRVAAVRRVAQGMRRGVSSTLARARRS